MDKKQRLLRIITTVVGGTAALSALAVSAYMLWEKPPEFTEAPESFADLSALTEQKELASTPTADSTDRGTAYDTARQDGVYTILLAGSDDGTGNTDTIMLCKLDTVRHSLSVVNIPRDTIINIDTPVRKLNSVYWGAVYDGGSGIDALQKHIKNLAGFEADCYAVIDLSSFIDAVDALGGIWFDVPERMYYDGGPVIDLEAGYQKLSGEQAMWLCRYRSGYIDGDIGRISVQQAFLKAAANQFLSVGSIPNLAQAASIIAERADTNLTASNIAYFARQLLMCDSEDINFYTAPNTPAYVQNLSYTFLDLYDWLELVNTKLNPGSERITEGMLDLIYLRNGSVCCTSTIKGIGYFDIGSSASLSGNTDNEAVAEDVTEENTDYSEPEPTTEPAPEPTPDFPEMSPPFIPESTPSNSDWFSET